MALAYLLLVLAGSARGGRLTGFVLSLVCFLAFNFFLISPHHTFRVEDPLDWTVLAAFLLTGSVAAELLHRQQLAARIAERRAREIDRLAGLGAESLSVARASDALEAILHVIRSELGVPQATIRLTAAGEPEAATAGMDAQLNVWHREYERHAVVARRIVTRSAGGDLKIEPPGARVADVLTRGENFTDVVVPLTVRDRMLGVVWLSDPSGLGIDASQAGFADALVYYGALAAERVRLATEAERVEALKETNRLKDALLASVSHDLRTPLTSIRATANALRIEGEARGALIEEEAERLNRTVTDLLDLSRLRAGTLPVSMELNAAEDLVGAALQRLSGVAGADGITVSLPEDGSIPVGSFDFVHSLRALTNLIENALRHSPASGSIHVGVGLEGHELVITVEDRGPGIPESDRALLYQPFFRSASAAGTQGTGLGLTIARGVAEAQGGAIHYEPRAGGGSRFQLRLPATPLEELP